MLHIKHEGKWYIKSLCASHPVLANPKFLQFLLFNYLNNEILIVIASYMEKIVLKIIFHLFVNMSHTHKKLKIKEVKIIHNPVT